MLATSASSNTASRSLIRFAWLTLAFFVLIVLWGAVVRATGSGGGCGSNWPLCNGYINPLHHPRLNTIIEFAHRQSTTVASCLMAILAVWIFRVTPKGHRARKAVLWTVFLLVTEALLGAALVLRHWVEKNYSTGRVVAQAVHFTNTLLLMAALSLTAWFLTNKKLDCPATAEDPALRPRRNNIALLALFSTIVVGATGALAALADTLFPSHTLTAAFALDFAAHAPVLIRMRWLHPAAAIVSLSCVLWMTSHAGFKSALSRTVLTLLVTQFVLGIADVLLLAPTWMQILHLFGADLYWIALVLLAAGTLWPNPLAPAEAATPVFESAIVGKASPANLK